MYSLILRQYQQQKDFFNNYWTTERLYYLVLGTLSFSIFIFGYRQLVTAKVLPDAWLLHLWVLQDPFALLLIVLSLAILVWQVGFALQYQPYPRLTRAGLPSLTVVIPAFNEGAQVLDTVRSVHASDYPKDLLQIICVDDGSKDDTWLWMKRAKAEFPECVTLIKQPRNMGKRAALMAGFDNARGEVIVTLDSDSEVLPHTFQECVSPFVYDQRVGSVAGNVRVLNLKEGVIPKMLEVSFTSAFDFIRAGQSVYGGVFCTPGALSAYRTSVLKSLLARWSEQRFLGNPANIGEDRALTNLVLAAGHRVVYQRDAIVLTKVPTHFTALRKMLLRWARSNVRENLVMLTFVFKNFRQLDTGSEWVRLFSVMQVLRMTLFEALKLVLIIALILNPITVLLSVIVGCLTAAIIPGFVYRLRYGSFFGFQWAVPFSFFWLFCLAWIPLWGMLTAGNSRWLTRNSPATPQVIPAAA